MAPSAVPQQDVNLTAAAIQRKEASVANGDGGQKAPLDASKLTYSLTKSPRPVPDQATANAGDETIATDHMVTATWKASTGWGAPELKPYGPLSLMPTASCLHYATECFEGLKVFRGHDGRLRVFRPDRNCARMHIRATSSTSARPSSAPSRSWQAPREAMLYIIVTFMPRMDSPPGGMRLHTSPEDMVRAWVGGFGYAKVGANYGPSLMATQDARRRGFHQILWLYGAQGECTEAGASNFFVVWVRKDGKKEIITAPLDDKLILDGVTRRSCLDVVRERMAGEIEVTERKYTIDELVEADAEGRILESFAAGTAYFICPVSQIHHRGKDINIPMGPEGTAGEVTARIKTWIGDIMYGREQHEWGVVIPEKEQ
ncbi:hypothetical protein MAA_08066 [Metarhizium robertsii ARSEF 23]|uniref:Branched-chain-amino-acid aminotransferase n=1 Tax=Metarhizium robertsii (strain ARSEF 23 / ATCC MYA-3075) TaxID=655844 RepID=E9F717_METRA|nr:uncharacterized protein MAA_08066 [Metarhizium robertsii ARSEF 23]EFY96569.1 hypothetical protein MAA_08066 [Metarhizium robertsii ARSEF 23]